LGRVPEPGLSTRQIQLDIMDATAGRDRVGQQAGNGHRANASRYRCYGTCDL